MRAGLPPLRTPPPPFGGRGARPPPRGRRAAGTAWGQWGGEDCPNPAARQQITAASAEVAPPPAVPGGLERLASLWTAPMPDYAPPVLKSRPFGYLLSAMFGVGLILLLWLAAGWFGSRFRSHRASSATPV